MRLAIAMLLLVACGGNERNPPGGGGGGPRGTSPVPDAGDEEEVDANVDVFVAGMVCNALELQSPRVCSGNPSGVVIGLREFANSETETAAGGAFSLPTPAEFRVTLEAGTNDEAFVPTTLSLELGTEGVSEVSMPVVPATEFAALATELNTLLIEDSTTIAIYLSNGGVPVSGATVLSVPSGTAGSVYFDRPGTPRFSAAETTTGSAGAILIFGVPSSVAPTSVMVSDGNQIVTLSGIASSANGVSFVFYDFAAADE